MTDKEPASASSAGIANDIATLLFAFWNHPAPSTRAQIECFIAKNLDGVTVQQLRECNLSAPSADLAALLQEWENRKQQAMKDGKMPQAARVYHECISELAALLSGRRRAQTEEK